MTVRYELGDTRAVVATLPDGSVSLVASSPPFIALRSYLPADHPAKHAEIGSEPDPAAFLDTLLGLTAEWGRVLAPWGSIAIELGDTYAGGGGWTAPDVKSPWRDVESLAVRGKRPAGHAWPRAKSLALIPQLYATSLAYGRNLLTGQPSPAGQWLVRNVIVWHRPNPAVGALGDKVRPSTSYITVATRSPKRWFDLDAVRTSHTVSNGGPLRGRSEGMKGLGIGGDAGNTWDAGERLGLNPAGAPPLDCWFDHHDTWTITTQPSSLAHYAMWPARLAERLILMMCPAEVCAACGTPRRRITESQKYVLQGAHWNTHKKDPTKGVLVPVDETMKSSGRRQSADDVKQGIANGGVDQQGFITHRNTTGWSDCGHDDYRPGVVLDPFAGTGTTLAVADLHGRDAIGIDLDERNRDLYPRRRDECARALFDVRPQMDGQLDMFSEVLL